MSKKPSKGDLEAVAFTFESPITGDTFQVTKLGALVLDLRSQIETASRTVCPELFSKHRAAFVNALVAAKADKKHVPVIVDVLVQAFEAMLKAQAESGKGEHPHAKAVRYAVGDILGIVDEEAHGTYHITKQPGGSDSKTVETISAAAVFAYRRLLELSYVPGL